MSAKTAKNKRQFKVSVDDALCDGCGVCIFFCKPKVFQLSRELSSRGSFPAVPVRPEDCNNCLLCELGCPQLAIYVQQVDGEGGAS